MRGEGIACAVLAGTDAKALPGREREAWRQQALLWFHMELVHEERRLVSAETRREAIVALRRLQHDTRLDPVRGEAALAELPRAEQVQWRAVWARVAALIAASEKP